MATRQYVGARYVPKFANPIQWDRNRIYEPLEMVTYLNNTYTSKKPVPQNIDINNNDKGNADIIIDKIQKYPYESNYYNFNNGTTNNQITLSDNNIILLETKYIDVKTKMLCMASNIL